MLLCSLCLCLGQLIWKLMPDFHPAYLFGGLIIYCGGALAMIFAYKNGELSVLQPINSMSYVFSTIAAIFILHESMSLINILGIVLIISGAIVIGVSSR